MSAANIPYLWMQAEFATPDPGTGKTIAPNKGITCINLEVEASTAETNFLAAPECAGQFLAIVGWQVGSGGTRTVTLADSGVFYGTEKTSFVISGNDQMVMLYSVASGSSFKWTFLPVASGYMLAGLFPVDVQQALSGAGAINATAYYTAWTTTGASQAGTLVNGRALGQRKRIQLIVDGGDGILTPANLAGGTTITFADVGDFAELIWDGAEWNAIQLGNDADGATAPVLA